jgi:hypothetical protein
VFKIFAFLVGSEWSAPSLLSGVIPGKVPSDWNHANVAPMYKKGDKHNPANYRPISLT